jgi:hypothetical protein
MKHASAQDLIALAPLLAQLRALPALTERKPGIFYCKSSAFLHFHTDAQGLFADVKIAGAFVRLDVTSRKGQTALLKAVKDALQ